MITKFKIYKIYPFKEITPFIEWFNNTYSVQMKKEGWFIAMSDFSSRKYKDGDFWQVERNDEDEIIEDDIIACDLAEKYGLIIDDEGVVIGFNGVSFLDHPESLDFYKHMNKYNL
jgi:hypothetical protein